MKHNIDGKKAEKATCEYLKKLGYKVLDTNWKTPKCEIDIVAKIDNCIHFVEVKYRKSSAQGTGFEYITYTKQNQMSYAAHVWVICNNWQGEYCLSAASVSGANFDVEFIKQII